MNQKTAGIVLGVVAVAIGFVALRGMGGSGSSPAAVAERLVPGAGGDKVSRSAQQQPTPADDYVDEGVDAGAMAVNDTDDEEDLTASADDGSKKKKKKRDRRRGRRSSRDDVEVEEEEEQPRESSREGRIAEKRHRVKN